MNMTFSALRIFARVSLILLFAVSLVPCHADEISPPRVALAKVYAKGIDVSQYWVSEKLDGVRGYWDGERLWSRGGNLYPAPDWFTRGFPAMPLDGELWLARNTFERLVGIVRTQVPDEDQWRQVKFMVFDLPAAGGTFTSRLDRLRELVEELDSPTLAIVPQFRLDNHDELMRKLEQVSAAGGEGLMLRRGDSLYQGGRTDGLLKLKLYRDAEARVVAHLPGKGKYTGMLGALLVEAADGRRFRIGTGFSDKERAEPPPVDSLVTYKYFGKTRRGLPRFASFLRIKKGF